MKKVLALLLAVILCVGLLAACAKPVEKTEDQSSGSNLVLEILLEQDDSMINNYSLMAVDPEAPFVDADGNAVTDVAINTEGATALIAWMLSDAGKESVSNYGVAEYGEHLFYWKDNAPVYSGTYANATEETKTIRLSTTTSVKDSGLLDYLLPQFEAATGYKVEVYSAGTGKAIANAKMGNADLILVHSKSQEEAFAEGGFARVLDDQSSARLTFMYNYFVLCGPTADPAGVKASATVKDAFAAIAEGKHKFVSRGDASGTHTKEISLWPEDLGITTEADSVAGYSEWYTYSNAGMGVCLTMANEMGGYILSDKATFLTFVKAGGIM